MKLTKLNFVYDKISFSNLYIEVPLESATLTFTNINPELESAASRYTITIKQNATGNERVYMKQGLTKLPKKYKSVFFDLIDLVSKINFDELKTIVVLTGTKLELQGKALDQYIESLGGEDNNETSEDYFNIL